LGVCKHLLIARIFRMNNINRPLVLNLLKLAESLLCNGWFIFIFIFYFFSAGIKKELAATKKKVGSKQIVSLYWQ
jgi:hypothetical protein